MINKKNSFSKALALALALGLTPWAAHGQCSRPVVVPAAPVGLSVTTVGDAVGGVYPDLLRSFAGKDGCSFVFSVVPRARQEVMFETGRADLLMPATRTPRRDEHGEFVPMVSSRAMLVSMNAERPPVRSLAELLERRELRVVAVRGYDYGEAYQAALKALGQQGRLVLAVDPVSVARSLNGGIADLTIMAPNILVGALQGDARLRFLIERMRYEPADELPWGESGLYISNKSGLTESDRKLLRDMMERSVKSGAFWRAFQSYHTSSSLTDSVRPR